MNVNLSMWLSFRFITLWDIGLNFTTKFPSTTGKSVYQENFKDIPYPRYEKVISILYKNKSLTQLTFVELYLSATEDKKANTSEKLGIIP